MTTRTQESDLDRLANLHGRIAVHAKALAGLEREITGHIEQRELFAVLVADTAIAENYTDPAQCLIWLTASHKSWLRANAEFNRKAERLIFYRYIVLPYPSLIRNSQRRQLLVDIIVLHLHLHLWHGVICGAVFLDPRKAELARVLEDLNFVAIPSHRVFLDNPAFYSGQEVRTSVLTDGRADRRLAEVHRLLFSGGRGRPIWLHYDEANFSGERLRGWRWEALRALFRNLYGPQPICAGCGVHTGTFELDHIAPVSRGFHQTLINFLPLCPKCNREKGDMIREDPFRVKLLLPEDLRTRELDDIHRLPPPWIGRLATPGVSRDIERRLESGG